MNDQAKQEGFINYEEGIQDMIITVDFEEIPEDSLWIFPVPADSSEVKSEFVTEEPLYIGEEVGDRFREAFTGGVGSAYFMSAGNQIWNFIPAGIFFVSIGGARGPERSEYWSGVDSTLVGHRKGAYLEEVTAERADHLYGYLKDSGFDVDEDLISVFNDYIGDDFTFLVAYVESDEEKTDVVGVRSTFPAEEIFYPMKLTGIYEGRFPVNIFVTGHVKPVLYEDIEDHTEVDYFINRREASSQIGCISNVSQLRSSLEQYYYDNEGNYPADSVERSESPDILKGVEETCWGPYNYQVDSDLQNYEFFAITSPGEKYYIDSDGNAERRDFQTGLEDFYGETGVEKGEGRFTRVVIDSPAENFTEDLRFTDRSPVLNTLKVFVAKNEIIPVILMYTVFTIIFSFITAGILGKIIYGKFKRFAMVGLFNVFTLLGFSLKLSSEKVGEDQFSKFGFGVIFSLAYTFLIMAPIWIFLIWH